MYGGNMATAAVSNSQRRLTSTVSTGEEAGEPMESFVRGFIIRRGTFPASR